MSSCIPLTHQRPYQWLTPITYLHPPQAAWRGYAVRKRDGRAKREARRRLQAAAADARRSPSRQIGNRAREALELLLRNNKNLVQVRPSAVGCRWRLGRPTGPQRVLFGSYGGLQLITAVCTHCTVVACRLCRRCR